MTLKIRPSARRDVLLQVAYLLDEFAFDAASRFPKAVEDAFAQLRKQPATGSPQIFLNPRLAGLRSWPVPGFEAIRVYYVHDRETIRVIRILHGKRDVARILSQDRG